MTNFGGNMALNIEQRLGQKLTNEQQLVWNYLLQRWPNMQIRPYVFGGQAAGTPIVTYNANTIYLAYSLTFTYAAPSALTKTVNFYDELNALRFSHVNESAYWDATAAAPAYVGNTFTLKDLWFSRILITGGAAYDFIGYVLTI